MGHWYSGSASCWSPTPEEATEILLSSSSLRMARSVADTALATSDVASDGAVTSFSAGSSRIVNRSLLTCHQLSGLYTRKYGSRSMRVQMLCDRRRNKEHVSQSCKVSGGLIQGRGVRGALADTA